MKTKEELNALKEEVNNLKKKLAELTEEELAQINGGFIPPIPCGEDPFQRIYDGSQRTVDLNNGVGPEMYDCSGLVD